MFDDDNTDIESHCTNEENGRDTTIGLIALIDDLVDTIIEKYGEDEASGIMYNSGNKLGKRVGKKCGHIEDISDALEALVTYIMPYYEIEIDDIYNVDDETVANVSFEECIIRMICGERGLEIPGPLCKCTKGYIEGALSHITGRHVELKHMGIEDCCCIGQITFGN